MPDLDGGHYFLTVLAPVRTEPLSDFKGKEGYTRSHPTALAQQLALLPTGPQNAGAPSYAWPSPFSRNTLNHFTRFAIIEAPHFNGRVSGDALATAVAGALGLKSGQPLRAQPDDRLTTPFLLFAADFDAQGLSAAEGLRAYATALWTTMADELTSIFAHCYGFEKVNSAATFHDYLRKCQIETTRPFNDYWADGLKAGNMWPALGIFGVGALAAVAGLVAWLVALAAFAGGRLLKMEPHWPDWMHWPPWLHGLASGPWGATEWLIGLPIGALLVGFVSLKLLDHFGSTPFPTAPDSDLPSVLKGLFLQQHVTQLAIDVQGLDDAALHARFGAFLSATHPGGAEPSLKPGAIHAIPPERTP